MLYMKVSQRLR